VSPAAKAPPPLLVAVGRFTFLRFDAKNEPELIAAIMQREWVEANTI
jgi:hypothetical protein